MDVLKIVQQLRDLAADPQNRATIVRDQGCLPGLVVFLDNDDPQVELTALEALHYLAQVPSNRPLMKNEMGLLISVKRIINRSSSACEVVAYAQKVYDLLSPPPGAARNVHFQYYIGNHNPKQSVHTTSFLSCIQSMLQPPEFLLQVWNGKIVARLRYESPKNRKADDIVLVSSGSETGTPQKPDVKRTRLGFEWALSQSHSTTRGSKFLGTSNRKAKLVILQIEHLKDEESRALVEEALLGVKGVVSFTFNMAQRRCTLRVRNDVEPDVLCHVIEETKVLSAKQVIRSDSGHEVLVSFGLPQSSTAECEKENTQPDKLPDYLPEQEKNSQLDDKAIERSGAVGQGGGWFSSVTNFFSNSLYW